MQCMIGLLLMQRPLRGDIVCLWQLFSLPQPPAPTCACFAAQAANVGDSAALFIEPLTGQVTEMTEDHRLTNPRERQRLQDMGIQVWHCLL